MGNRLLLGVVVLTIAVVVRLVNLNSLPVFADESIYVRWAQVMRAESSLRFLPLSDGKQPLFMWTTIPVLKLVADPLIAGRLVSVAAGVGTVIAVGLLAYLLWGSWRSAVVAGAIYATIPYAAFFDRMALVDSLLTFWLSWTFVFFLLAVRHVRLDMAMLAGFTLGFAWLTKSPAVFGVALLPAWLLLAERKNLWRGVWLLVPTLVITWGMYNILRLGPEWHMIAARNADYVYSWREVLRHPLDPLVPHLRDVVSFYIYLATPLGLILAAWGVMAGKWEHWRSRLVLAAWWLGPIVVSAAIAKTFTARYILFSLPAAVLLMTRVLERRQVALGLFLVVNLIATTVLITRPEALPLPRIERVGYLEQWTAGWGLKEVSQSIREAAKLGPVVVGSEGFFGTPFSALQMYLNDVPSVRVIGVGVWIDRVHPDLLAAAGENQVFLVVNSSRWHIADPQREGLTLIASYPKAVPPEGEQEYLLFFKLE